MGLALSVGLLAWHLGPDGDPEGLKWLRRDLKRLNKLLVANGLPEHTEPEMLPRINSRGSLSGFSYSSTHHLRRAVAYARHAPKKFAKIDRDADPTEDPLLDDEYSIHMNSHLCCHSDCEGFYVPIDFPEPLYADDKHKITGDIVGSSQRLLAELVQAAPLLGIRLGKTGKLSDKEATKLADEDDEDEGSHRYGLERTVWFAFYEAASASVTHNTVMSFG